MGVTSGIRFSVFGALPLVYYLVRSRLAAATFPAISSCSAANHFDSGVHAPPTDLESTVATANQRLAVPAPLTSHYRAA